MPKITYIKAREILDSRGNPTVECDLKLNDLFFGRASVPSGASTGRYEALELRDNENNRYQGKGVLKAANNINNFFTKKILSKDFDSIKTFDENLITLDGTENKSNYGANSILALSLAFAKAFSSFSRKNLYDFLSYDKKFVLPVPMINIVNGGRYDKLIFNLGSKQKVPAVGAALNII